MLQESHEKKMGWMKKKKSVILRSVNFNLKQHFSISNVNTNDESLLVKFLFIYFVADGIFDLFHFICVCS